MEKFDTIIIGAGPAGLAAAYNLKGNGQKVAVIENNLWGGKVLMMYLSLTGNNWRLLKKNLQHQFLLAAARESLMPTSQPSTVSLNLLLRIL